MGDPHLSIRRACVTCIWLAGIFGQFHRQGGGGDSNVHTYIPLSLQLFYQTCFFLRSTPRYQKTFEKKGFAWLAFGLWGFLANFTDKEGGGVIILCTHSNVYIPARILSKIFLYMKKNAWLAFHIWKKFDRILAGMYTLECVHSIITPPPLLVCKIGQKSTQAKCKSRKPIFSKVSRYLGVDLEK